MGLQSFLFGGKPANSNGSSGGALATGSHSVTKDAVFSLSAGRPDPTNPVGLTADFNLAPVVPEPRMFTKEEAAAIKKFRQEASAKLAPTKSAYNNLSKMAKISAEVVKVDRKYRRTEVRAKVDKTRANAGYARTLQSARADYAQIGSSFDRAVASADRRIGEIQAKVAGAWN